MQFKRPFVVFVALLAVVALFAVRMGHPGVVQAQHTRPASINCSGGCNSYVDWPGDIWGAQNDFTASNPGVTGSNSWGREQNMFNGQASVFIGIEKNTGECGSGLYFFTDVTDVNGNSILPTGGTHCVPLNSNDVNFGFFVEESRYVSNGGGIFTEMFGNGSGEKVFWYPESSDNNNIAQTYTSYDDYEWVYASWSGHLVWGSQWTQNYWEDTQNGAWHPQGTDVRVNKNDTAPQMFWHEFPSQSSTGGVLYSCDYDTGSTCNFGS